MRVALGLLLTVLLYCSFIAFVAADEAVYVTVEYAGSAVGCETGCADNDYTYFNVSSCSGDGSWANGTRFFQDPVPSGNLVVGVSVVVFGKFACGSQGSTVDAMVSLAGTPVGPISGLPPDYSNCTCISCIPSSGVNVTGTRSNSGWSGYEYGEQNEVSLTLVSDSVSCVSEVVIELLYRPAVPICEMVRPNASPLDYSLEVAVLGSEFLPSEDLLCHFGNVTAPGSYAGYNLIQCDAPKNPTAEIVELTVDTSGGTIDCGDFIYYAEPTITSFEPTSGSSVGNYDVYVTGLGFFNNTQILCRFAQNSPVKGQYIDDTTIMCENPTDVFNKDGRSVFLSITMNSYNYVQAPSNFTFLGYGGPAMPTPYYEDSLSDYSSQDNPANDGDDGSPNSIPGYVWAAVALALVVLIIVIIAVAVVGYTRYNSRRSGYDIFPDGSGILSDRAASVHSSSDLLDIESNLIPIKELRHFKLLEKGSFGVIYQAQWRGIVIAVKKLPSTEMTDRQLREFYQEAALMRSLRHPNILQYLGIANAGGEICICMEYMPNGSLYRLLHSEDSAFRSNRIRAICLDTARGMNYLHKQQSPIIHRDLKSHNLLVDEHWRVKVCDFGLSRLVNQSNATMTACGTPSWTAPEVLRNERYTTKADVYGFGVVVWEMFARRDPFPGMPPFQIVFAVGTQGLRPDVGDDWPAAWVRLITDCWDEDPDARPTFDQVIDRLEGLPDIK